MRTILLILTLLLTLQVTAQVKVRGYYRKDGTYVRPHYRSNPDGNPYNNWSFPGNTNPYTGKTATGNPETYLRNYYNRSSNNSRSSSYNNSSTNYTRPSINQWYNNSSNNSRNSYYSTNYVTANSLNVRSGPSTNYSVIGSLTRGTNVNIIEAYSNGWKKIQYSYFDSNSFSMKTQIGYASGSYLSTTNPYFVETRTVPNNYNNTNYYSNLTATSPPYGHGNGRLTIWTNCGTDGVIKIYLDGSYVGELTQYYTDGIPSCGETGTLSVNRPAGTYRIEAKGNENVWSGTITITKDRCLLQGLQK